MTSEPISTKQDFDPLSQKFKIEDNILFRQVENEGVLLNAVSGAYFNLGEISILFWQALSQNKPLESVVDKVVDEYEVEREVVVEDLHNFLQSLLDYGIVQYL